MLQILPVPGTKDCLFLRKVTRHTMTILFASPQNLLENYISHACFPSPPVSPLQAGTLDLHWQHQHPLPKESPEHLSQIPEDWFWESSSFAEGLLLSF